MIFYVQLFWFINFHFSNRINLSIYWIKKKNVRIRTKWMSRSAKLKLFQNWGKKSEVSSLFQNSIFCFEMVLKLLQYSFKTVSKYLKCVESFEIVQLFQSSLITVSLHFKCIETTLKLYWSSFKTVSKQEIRFWNSDETSGFPLSKMKITPFQNGIFADRVGVKQDAGYLYSFIVYYFSLHSQKDFHSFVWKII